MRPITNKRITILGISIIWLIILIYVLSQLSLNNTKIPNNYKEQSDKINNQPSYEIDFNQNKNDYSYQITVTNVSGTSMQTNNVKMNLVVENSFITDNNLLVSDYISTRIIFYKCVIENNISKPYSELKFINLSISITYIDKDNDNHLSENDYLIIKNKDIDKNEYYNFTQFKFELNVIEGNILTGINFNHLPDFNDSNKKGEDSYPAEDNK